MKLFYCKFPGECFYSEGILKICRYLTKLCVDYVGLLFLAHPVNAIRHDVYYFIREYIYSTKFHRCFLGWLITVLSSFQVMMHDLCPPPSPFFQDVEWTPRQRTTELASIVVRDGVTAIPRRYLGRTINT